MDASDEEDKISEEESKQFDNPVINQKYYGKDGTKWTKNHMEDPEQSHVIS